MMLLCLAGVTVRADAPRLLHAEPGTRVQWRDQGWGEIRVHLENPGPERTVVIHYEPHGRNRGQRPVFQRVVELPARARRHFVVPVFHAAGAPPAQRVSETGVVRLTDPSSGTEWDRYALLAALEPAHQPSIAALTHPTEMVRLPTVWETGHRRQEWVRQVYSRDLFTGHPAALAAVDSLVFIPNEQEPLDAGQRRAVHRWVKTGGILVLAPGAMTTPDLWREWMDLLPVRYTAQPHETSHVAALDEFGAPLIIPDGLLQWRMQPRPGAEVLAGPATDPLAVGWPRGNGWVVALSFNPGGERFPRWDGAETFWSRVLPQPSPLERYALDMWDREEGLVDNAMAHLTGVSVPRKAQAARWLGTMAALLAVLLLGAHFLRHPEWGWAAAVTAALLLAAVLFTAAHRRSSIPLPALNEISIVRGQSGEGGATVQAALAFYAPRHEKFELTAVGPLPPAPGYSRMQPPDVYTAVWNGSPRLTDFRVRPQTIRSVRTVTQWPHPLPAATLRVGEDGVRIEASVPAEWRPDETFFRWNRLVIPLDVPDATVMRGTSPTTPPARPRYQRPAVLSPAQAWRERLRRALFAEPSEDGAARITVPGGVRGMDISREWAVPRYYGWSNAAVLPIPADREMERRGWAFWSVAVEPDYAPGPVRLPAGTLELSVPAAARHAGARQHGIFQGMNAETFEIEYTLPAGAPDLRITGARIWTDFTSQDFTYRLQVLPPAADRGTAPDPVEWTATATAPLEIPAAPRFYDQRNRRFRLRVQVYALPEAPARAGRGWRFQQLELELTAIHQPGEQPVTAHTANERGTL